MPHNGKRKPSCICSRTRCVTSKMNRAGASGDEQTVGGALQQAGHPGRPESTPYHRGTPATSPSTTSYMERPKRRLPNGRRVKEIDAVLVTSGCAYLNSTKWVMSSWRSRTGPVRVRSQALVTSTPFYLVFRALPEFVVSFAPVCRSANSNLPYLWGSTFSAPRKPVPTSNTVRIRGRRGLARAVKPSVL